MDLSVLESVLLLAGGLLAGFYGSAVGSGGLVTFPLLLALGMPIHTAIGTIRLNATFLTGGSVARYAKEKKLDVKDGLFYGVLAAAGAIAGSLLVVEINEDALRIVVAVLLVAALLSIALKDRLPKANRSGSKKKKGIAALTTAGIGMYGGFFGPGFGTFILLVFLYMGKDFVKSAAASRLVGLLMSGSALIVFSLHGIVDYRAGIILGIGSLIGSWIGAGLAVKKGNNYVRVLFIVVGIVTVGKLLFDAAN